MVLLRTLRIPTTPTSAAARAMAPGRAERRRSEHQQHEGGTAGTALQQLPNTAPAPIAPATQPTEAPETPAAQPSDAFQQGQADRQSWETWLANLTGEQRAGAHYWVAHRSMSHRSARDAAPPSTGADWTTGCLAAQTLVNAADVRRKTEPKYRLGWNNPSPIEAPHKAAEPARSPNSAQPPTEPPKVPLESVLPSTKVPIHRWILCLPRLNPHTTC